MSLEPRPRSLQQDTPCHTPDLSSPSPSPGFGSKPGWQKDQCLQWSAIIVPKGTVFVRKASKPTRAAKAGNATSNGVSTSLGQGWGAGKECSPILQIPLTKYSCVLPGGRGWRGCRKLPTPHDHQQGKKLRTQHKAQTRAGRWLTPPPGLTANVS